LEDDFENTDKDLPSYSPRLGNVQQSTESVKENSDIKSTLKKLKGFLVDDIIISKKNDDSTDFIGVANALLKLGVGDPYRLKQIKQAYIQDKTIWKSEKNYLRQMGEKYLTKHSDVQTEIKDSGTKLTKRQKNKK